jgi:hypothetical protein
MIAGKPITGYMLLGLALEYVDCFNREEAPMVLQCFERVVSVESERVIEQLFEETVDKINQTITFENQQDENSPFTNLEKVYTETDLESFMESLMAQCD